MPNTEQQENKNWWDISPSAIGRNLSDFLHAPTADTSRKAYGPGAHYDKPSPQQEGEDLYNRNANPVTAPFHKAENFLNDKVISPFRAGLDNKAHDLERAGIATHSPLLAGAAKAMEFTPVGDNLRDTIGQALVPPGMGPEEKALWAEKRLGEVNRDIKPIAFKHNKISPDTLSTSIEHGDMPIGNITTEIGKPSARVAASIIAPEDMKGKGLYQFGLKSQAQHLFGNEGTKELTNDTLRGTSVPAGRAWRGLAEEGSANVHQDAFPSTEAGGRAVQYFVPKSRYSITPETLIPPPEKGLQPRLSPFSMPPEQLESAQAKLTEPIAGGRYEPVKGAEAERFFGKPSGIEPRPTWVGPEGAKAKAEAVQTPNVFKAPEKAPVGSAPPKTVFETSQKTMNDTFSDEYDKLHTMGKPQDAEKLRKALGSLSAEQIVTETPKTGSVYADRALDKIKKNILASNPEYFENIAESVNIAKKKGVTGYENAPRTTQVTAPTESTDELFNQLSKTKTTEKRPSVWEYLNRDIGKKK